MAAFLGICTGRADGLSLNDVKPVQHEAALYNI